MDQPFSPASLQISTNSAPHMRQAIYSFDWAMSIVERAWKSHPRAWEIIGRAFALSKRQLAFLVACNAPEWPYIREISHKLDKWATKQENCRPGSLSTISQENGLVRALTRECQKCPIPLLKAYLTAKIEELTL